MEDIEQSIIIKTKLFHPILVTLCALMISPLFLYFSFVLITEWLNGEIDSIIGLVFILFLTLGMTVWGFNAIKSVLFRPRIIVSPKGAYFDISRRSRSWGVIPWDDIVGVAAVRSSRMNHYLFIYLSSQSPLYVKARKDKFKGGSFLGVNTRYIDKGSSIASVLAEKGGLEYSPATFVSMYGKTQD